MSLPEAFSHLRLRQPALAAVNLERLSSRLSGASLDLLPVVLGQLPDPDTALNNLERFTRAADGNVLRGLGRKPVLLHYLLAFFSFSRYLTETVIQQPDLILWLERQKSLARIKSAEDLKESYARFESTTLEVDAALTLVRFKRREYLRIALKDILRLAEVAEVTLELSILADVLLEEALNVAGKELEKKYGWPHTSDPQGRPVRARFAVISLGKLGGRELNYSSDVDLMFLYDGEGHTPGGESGEALTASEFFLRLAQRLMQLIAGLTSEGPVFRVDLRLRPGGGEGNLVISLAAAVAHYRERAREWELQMLLKARASAGSDGLVREFLTSVEPILYRKETRVDMVESVLNARGLFDEKLSARPHERVDVKLSPGGIRDIEFLVQCLQRIYGRSDRWVRSASTLLALQRLADKGYLTPRDHHHLATAYQFLRLVEHRLQLDQGQQTHLVPESAQALERLARRCHLEESPAGLAAPEATPEGFRALLRKQMERVEEIYRRVLPRSGAGEEEPFRLLPPEMPMPAQGLEYPPLLHELQKRSESLYQAVLDLEIPDPARRVFQRFLEAAIASPEVLPELVRRADALPLALDVMSCSDPLADLLTRRPEQFAFLPGLRRSGEDAARLPFPEEAEGEADFDALPAGHAASASLQGAMAELRESFRDYVFCWGVLSLWGRTGVHRPLRKYSAAARRFIERAWQETERLQGEDNVEVAVIALGRLGTWELDYGSDLDLVFVAHDQNERGRARPLVEKFIHLLSAYTQDGTLYQVDTRLRPLGKEGELVQTAEGALDYFRNQAQLWEAAAYLKALPLLGGSAARQWCTQMRNALAERFGNWERIRTGLLEMRRKLEVEGAAVGPEHNFKAGPGGVYDIDFIVSALALRSRDPDLSGRSLAEQVERMQSKGLLAGSDARVLVEAAIFYRTVDHAVRLATGRSASELPGGIKGGTVAGLVGRWLSDDFSRDTLATRMAETRRAVRGVFQCIFDVAAS